MVHFVIQWNLPDQKANLTIYANKAKNDWLPTTLAHKGVIEIRNYRNPLEVTPHVAITIDFERLARPGGFNEARQDHPVPSALTRSDRVE